jgi:hypothetical protein
MIHQACQKTPDPNANRASNGNCPSGDAASAGIRARRGSSRHARGRIAKEPNREAVIIPRPLAQFRLPRRLSSQGVDSPARKYKNPTVSKSIIREQGLSSEMAALQDFTRKGTDIRPFGLSKSRMSKNIPIFCPSPFRPRCVVSRPAGPVGHRAQGRRRRRRWPMSGAVALRYALRRARVYLRREKTRAAGRSAEHGALRRKSFKAKTTPRTHLHKQSLE